MKRYIYLFYVVLSVAAISCSEIPEDLLQIQGIPGVDIGKGDGEDAYNKTTYLGARLPKFESSRASMIEVLTMIGQQEGEIDDELFVEKLTSTVFSCQSRFMYIHDKDGEEPDHWSDAHDWVGGQMFYSSCINEDGSLTVRQSIGCADPEFAVYMEGLGYRGYHITEYWNYDASNDLLYTSHDNTFVAKVLYFDGESAILQGYVYPMWLYNADIYSRSTPMELYHFEFVGGNARERFLEGYELTCEEFVELHDQFDAMGSEF